MAISCRLAIAVQSTRRDIQSSNESWASIISNIDERHLQAQIDELNATLSPVKRVQIADASFNNITITGPPSTLNALLQSETVTKSKSTTAHHLKEHFFLPTPHSSIQKELELLGASPLLHSREIQTQIYSAHSANGILMPTGTLKETLEHAAADFLHHPARVDVALTAVAGKLQEAGKTQAMLSVIGSTSDVAQIYALFRDLGLDVANSEQITCPQPFGDDVESVPRHEIAIVGMSGRFPESDTLDELWGLLESGTATHKEVPSNRFNVDDFYDPSRRTHNAMLSRHGCFIKRPGDFDHRLFNISPREAAQMDPVQRMFLMTTYEALEMAGYSPASDSQSPPRIATYFGQTVDDWKTINDQQGIDTHYLPAVNRSFTPGRIGHFFKWAGGFYSIDTGCSSSATALCLAREALASGECDAAVVGGGTLLAAPEWFAGLGQGGFLSQTGACKTYTDAADGYCRGEGVAVVVLKRVADAVASKDNILGVIAGASRNCNAGAGSITYPGQDAQSALYRRVLRQAGVRPNDVGVVEMHGTGTQAGDKVEMNAIQSVFISPTEPPREQPLVVGAIKASVGHSEAAAGLVSLIKSILMLQRDCVPPQPGQPFSLNPNLKPIIGSNIQIGNGQKWNRSGNTPRYVLINNFDAAGGNASLLLHDTPSFAVQPSPFRSDERSHHVVVTSGRTFTSLEANRRRLFEHLKLNPEIKLADLAYTTTARRMHHVQRAAYVAKSIQELYTQLERPLHADDKAITSPAASSVVFAFTGQGSQHLGMGGLLYRTSPAFRRLLDSYQSLGDAQELGCQFVEVIRAAPVSDNGDKKPLSATAERDLQVATVALEIALAQYWQDIGLQPTLVIGHSLGEYAALCVAGVLSVGDALAMAFKRAAFIFGQCEPSKAGMLSVGLPASTVRWRLRDSAAAAGCEITCINSPTSTVVGGPVAAIEALDDYLKANDVGVSTTRLRVQFAFHTRQMDSLLEDLESEAKGLTFNAPKIPVASTLLGRVVQPGEASVFNAEYMRRHTREPVAFVDAIRACEGQGLIQNESFLVEIGPHPICLGLISSSLENTKLTGYSSLRRGRDDWESMSNCMAAAFRAQLPVSWPKFHKDHLESLAMVTGLPSYAFDLKEFWYSYKTRSEKTEITGQEQSQGSRLSSTTLHSVEELQQDKSQISATFRVDLSDANLAKAIGGHVVDNVAICPASIFMDMAYAAAAYLDGTNGNDVTDKTLSACELADLKMLSPLVLRKHDTNVPKVSVQAVLDKSTQTVTIRFLSRKESSAAPIDHGSCLIRLNQNNSPVTQGWSRIQSLVKARMQTLDTLVRPTQVHAMDKTLFYKIFSEIVDYSAEFHAVQDATIATTFQDAAINLRFTNDPRLGNFTCNPFAIDALIHIAGFLLNADVRKPKEDVHIANHIGSVRVLGDLSSNDTFRAYTAIRQQDIKTGTSICDVYLTDVDDNLVALSTDICFKKLSREFFSVLTGASRGSLKQQPVRPVREHRNARTRSVSPTSSGASTPMSSESMTASLSSASSVSDMVDSYTELLAIVAQQLGMSVSELEKSSNVTFTELGVDSQMSISILADFQKATGEELPAAFFTNFPTPAQAHEELNPRPVTNVRESDKTKERSRKPSPSAKRSKKAKPDPSNLLLGLVADALGLDASDLSASTAFESVGMDSMLSIRITSAFQDKTGIELPAAFFTDCPTVADVIKELYEPADEAHLDESRSASQRDCGQQPGSSNSQDVVLSEKEIQIQTSVSRAVLIQGKSKSTDPPLFMTTDGSGTVESYIHLSALPKGRRIYALESPFLEKPETFDLSIEEMATIFIRTIRRIQPQGPYLIGGWSAGSMYAYEVARRLTEEGETIQSLIILDMRAPSLIPTSIVTTDFVDKLGTFEGINRARDLPEDLSVKEKTHLMRTCRALSKFDAKGFPAGRFPRKVAVVWAKLGLDNHPDAPVAAMCRPGLDIGKRLEEMNLDEFERYFNSWFYGRREQFGTNGWEDLLGPNISVHVVDGGKLSDAEKSDH